MDTDLLYLNLKHDIMRKIYDGVYPEGNTIPSERVLDEQHNLSRDTVRKAIDLLERDGVVEKKLGKGTVVSLSQRGSGGQLDMIALVAPAQRRFFAKFINYFQRTADRHGSLVVFIQQSEGESIEDTLFKLLMNNIRNVVIWLDYESIRREYIKRLRGLGMNIVFFDITVQSPYADCVCLDNRDAVSALYRHVLSRGYRRIAYVSREILTPSSVYERQAAFMELAPKGMVWTFPQNEMHEPDGKAGWRFVVDKFMPVYRPDAIICGDGELGIVLKRALQGNGIDDVLLVSLDDFDEAEDLKITVLRQPYDRFAESIYTCLKDQNFSPKEWAASMHRVRGELVVRDGGAPAEEKSRE